MKIITTKLITNTLIGITLIAIIITTIRGLKLYSDNKERNTTISWNTKPQTKWNEKTINIENTETWGKVPATNIGVNNITNTTPKPPHIRRPRPHPILPAGTQKVLKIIDIDTIPVNSEDHTNQNQNQSQ